MPGRKSAIDDLTSGRVPHIVLIIPRGHVCARAAEERRARGVPPDTLTPWWRLLRKGGFLNPEFPRGTAQQAELLGSEGVRVSPLRRQPAVFDLADGRSSAPWLIAG